MLLPISHASFVVILIFISFFVAYFLRNNYKVGVFFVTIMMVVLMQLSKTGSWDLILWRVLATVIGSALALLISLAFWPIWEKQRFPRLLESSLRKNLTYLEQVIQSYAGKLPSGITWHKSRRQAEAANNDLFACVQRMYEEPEAHKREIDAHFAKVGVNVRIAREITSLAFALEKHPKNEELLTFLEDYKNELASIFEHLIIRNADFNFEGIMDLVNNSTILKLDENQAIRMDLEKIVFELAALKAFRRK